MSDENKIEEGRNGFEGMDNQFYRHIYTFGSIFPFILLSRYFLKVWHLITSKFNPMLPSIELSSRSFNGYTNIFSYNSIVSL